MVDFQDMIGLLQGSPFGVSVARRSDGAIVFANSIFTGMLGIDPGKFIGTKARNWFIEDAQREDLVRQLKTKGAAEGQEVRFRRADGSAVCVLATIRPGMFDDEPVNLAWIADITDRKDTETRLQAAVDAVDRARDSVQTLLQGSPFGVSVARRSDGIIVFANRAFTDMLGVNPSDYIGTPARKWIIAGSYREDAIEQLKSDATVEGFEVEFRRADGSPVCVLITIRPGTFNGEAVNLAWMADITERKVMEGQLELASKVVETASEGIFVTDAQTRIETVNSAFTQITGFTANDVVGQLTSILASDRHTPEFFHAMWGELGRTGHWQGEVWNRRKDGGVYLEWLSIATVRDAEGKVVHYVGIFTDITVRKENEDRVWRQANFDTLTGLPNRAHFINKLLETVQTAQRDGGRFAVLFIDLDGFKAVNDQFGHAAGDRLLQLAAERLKSALRASDLVARLAGDEFAAVIVGENTVASVRRVARKLLDVLRRPFNLGDGEAQVGGSIGIARFPNDGADPVQLLKLADLAMYAVKRSGKNNLAIFGEAAAASSIAKRVLTGNL